jgi:uncharacterized protein (DUF1778 family)
MAAPATHSTVINLRADERRRELIDRAADAVGKNRSEFMLDAAIREATAVLLDQRYFQLDSKTFTQFVAALDAPQADRAKLRKLLSRKSPWEK